MSDGWPWQENETDRLRRIIHHYRNALLEECPTRCLTVDELMFQYGQEWITDDEIIDVDQLLTAREVCEYIAAKWGTSKVSPFDVRNWERAGAFVGEKRGSRKYFRLGDVLVEAQKHN
ncbi:hypothetical protein [Mycobacteroides chelonae]|uniref:hypothetical protein n=1 Tax=Mycobacteroides chelonae TaxID=1774 RepID=UPI00091365FB|nr:hypothetical protein [Mycobacteroides chelonae]OHT95399.1 hypothetical protein BKG71_23540 [Mycobacteroides chelonae]